MRTFFFLFCSLSIFLQMAMCDDAPTSNITTMEEKSMTPEYLYKIISLEQWKESLTQEYLPLQPIDTTFIHLSKEDQLPHVLEKFWKGQSYVIAKVRTAELEGRLVHEKNPGGTSLYYHLYEGSIPTRSIESVNVIK